jgi:hypothetical protein
MNARFPFMTILPWSFAHHPWRGVRSMARPQPFDPGIGRRRW